MPNFLKLHNFRCLCYPWHTPIPHINLIPAPLFVFLLAIPTPKVPTIVSIPSQTKYMSLSMLNSLSIVYIFPPLPWLHHRTRPPTRMSGVHFIFPLFPLHLPYLSLPSKKRTQPSPLFPSLAIDANSTIPSPPLPHLLLLLLLHHALSLTYKTIFKNPLIKWIYTPLFNLPLPSLPP